jgi:hypothetical protein
MVFSVVSSFRKFEKSFRSHLHIEPLTFAPRPNVTKEVDKERKGIVGDQTLYIFFMLPHFILITTTTEFLTAL